ncbi:DUF4186 domain-containing protein [Martelella alba]|uniref:DUF4186 domain-containing protein n=1 Tax=Martelella alba TaxID=2590451 RepID=A0A506U7H2_9HYPH|nr:DUF4186 domain-containing protein [Martelella alba]TPW28905.1 DUF4186 domain-containing protein [Martelella alba]
MDELDSLFGRLSKSRFRSRFHLSEADKAYAMKKGRAEINGHVDDFVRQRLSPAEPANDGKQTPMRGHPCFIAQHATATCCRGCLEKWHGIEKGRALDEAEIAYVCRVIDCFIVSQMSGNAL